MNRYTDISRDTILRKRTPKKSSRSKREKKVIEEPVTEPHKETKVELPTEVEPTSKTPLEHSCTLQKVMNSLMDEKWKKRDISEYEVGIVIKLSHMIEIYGWKWWNPHDGEVDVKSFAIKLCELYQFVTTLYLKSKKKPPKVDELKSNSLSNTLLLNMIKSVSVNNLDDLFIDILSIAKIINLDIHLLNITILTSRYIKTW